MSYKIVYLPLVFEDIKGTNDFYNSRRKGLGKEFMSVVKSEFKKIVKDPLSYQVKYNNTRIAFIKGFPFGIHFEILETINTIVVKSVFHTSRTTEIWNKR